MSEKIIIDGEINEDGELIIKLPSDVPHGAVKVTIESTSERTDEDFEAELEALLADETTFTGMGLTMGEIALADEIGILENNQDFPDGETYVEQIRKKRRYTW